MSFMYKLDVDDQGSAKVKRFSSEVDKAAKGTKQLDAGTSSLSKELGKIRADRVSGLTKGFAGLVSPVNLAAAAAGAAIAGIAMLTKEMMSSYDSAAKLGRNTNIAAIEIIGLRHAAELSGVGAQNMDAILNKLSADIGKARMGSGEAAVAFKELGINLLNTNGTLKSADQVLPEIADKMQGMGQSSDRARVATQLFGESGVRMIDMLKGGSAGLAQMTTEGTAAAGNVEQISALVEDFNTSMVRLKAAAIGVMAVLADTGPVEFLVTAVKELSKEWVDFVGSRKNAAEVSASKKEYDQLNLLENAAIAYYNALGKAQANSTALQRSMQDYMQAAKSAGASDLDLANRLSIASAEAIKFNKENTRISAAAREEQLTALTELHEANLRNQASARASQKAADAAAAAKIKSAADEQAALEKAHQAELHRQKQREAAEKAAADAAKRRAEERKRLEEEVVRAAMAAESRMAAIRRELAQEELLNQHRQARGVQEISEFEYDQLNQLATARAENSLKNMFQLERETTLARQKYEQDKAMLLTMHEVELALSADKTATRAQHLRDLSDLQGELALTEVRLKKEDAVRGEEKAKKDLEAIASTRDAQLDAAAANASAFTALTAESRKYRLAYKAGAVAEAGINAAQSVLRTMSATPYPWNIPLAVMQGIAAGLQVQKIASAKMHTGGMISGKDRLILTNEDGPEAILSTSGVRAAGGPTGVSALNSGTSIHQTYNNDNQQVININVGMISQKTLNDQLLPALRTANYRY